MNADSNNPSLNDLKCIWMTSGLVAYKLCNFQFDCENCEFDRVFRKNAEVAVEKININGNEFPNPVNDLIDRVREEYYNEKLIYLKNQLVLKKIFGNVCYLGINPIILHLVDNSKSIEFTAENFMKKDNIFMHIYGEWGKIEFISPIDCTIIEKFIIPSAKPGKWIAIITTDEADISQYNTESWNNEKIKCIEILKRKTGLTPAIGQTAMDGGEKIESVCQFLGKEEYLRLIKGIFP
jgi:hypothetical protein